MKLEFSPPTQGYSFCWRGAHSYATSSTQLHACVNQEESRTNLEEAGSSLLKRGIPRLTMKESSCAQIIKPQRYFRDCSLVFSILATLQKKIMDTKAPPQTCCIILSGGWSPRICICVYFVMVGFSNSSSSHMFAVRISNTPRK